MVPGHFSYELKPNSGDAASAIDISASKIVHPQFSYLNALFHRFYDVAEALP
jgi:hypothetical protein